MTKNQPLRVKMDAEVEILLRKWAETYNNEEYFQEDPIAFPREVLKRGMSLKDIEIAAVFASYLAWGRRCMIVRDTERLMEQMEWKPLDYVMSGDWRDDDSSCHRTIKWRDIAAVCARLKDWYSLHDSLETLSPSRMRTDIFGSKPDPKSANKKINMMRRWMVRRDGKVDLGLWTSTSPGELIIPLDVHVHTQACALGLTTRNSKDIVTATEITNHFREIWPDDPLLGDFALFGYGVTHS